MAALRAATIATTIQPRRQPIAAQDHSPSRCSASSAPVSANGSYREDRHMDLLEIAMIGIVAVVVVNVIAPKIKIATPLLLVLLGILGAEPLTRWIAGGYAAKPGKLELTTQLTRIMFPFLTLVAVAVAFMGMLNSLRRFFIPALAPAMFNVGAILSVYIFVPFMPRLGWDPMAGLALGTLLGGLFLAMALAFGLGGRDVANRMLSDAYDSGRTSSGRFRRDHADELDGARAERRYGATEPSPSPGPVPTSAGLGNGPTTPRGPSR